MEMVSNIVMIEDTNRYQRYLIYEYRILIVEEIKVHATSYIGHKTRQ